MKYARPEEGFSKGGGCNEGRETKWFTIAQLDAEGLLVVVAVAVAAVG